MRTLLASVVSSVVAGSVVAAVQPPQTAASARTAPAPTSSACADTGAVVQRAAAYVAQFGQDLGSVIATEDYRQEIVGAVEPQTFEPPPITITQGIQVRPATPMTSRTSLRQTLRSSFLFVQGMIGTKLRLVARETSGRRDVAGLIREQDVAGWRLLLTKESISHATVLDDLLSIPHGRLFGLARGPGLPQARDAHRSGRHQQTGT